MSSTLLSTPGAALRSGIVRHTDLVASALSFGVEAFAGLAAPRKELPLRYTFDAPGIAAFGALCRQPEYYLARAELAATAAALPDLARIVGPGALLVEFGAYSSARSRLVARALAPILYVPVGITRSALEVTIKRLAHECSWLNIWGLTADFERSLLLPNFTGLESRRRVIYWPGSTLAGVDPRQTLALLKQAHKSLGRDGILIAGVDMTDDSLAIESARNDAAGASAALNLNLLARMNRELAADFREDYFTYRAAQDVERGCWVGEIVSVREQRVHVGGDRVMFRAGEAICTETAWQHPITEFHDMARWAGFSVARVWTDRRDRFALHALVAA